MLMNLNRLQRQPMPRMQGVFGGQMPRMPMQQEKGLQRGSRLQQAMKRRLAGLRRR